jgi:hypothetical protein
MFSFLIFFYIARQSRLKLVKRPVFLTDFLDFREFLKKNPAGVVARDGKRCAKTFHKNAGASSP